MDEISSTLIFRVNLSDQSLLFALAGLFVHTIVRLGFFVGVAVRSESYIFLFCGGCHVFFR